MLVFGSVHAFSMFLVPLESAFNVSRTSSTFTYSLALACLTAFVLIGPLVFKRVTPVQLVCLICALASLGSLLAGFANNLMLVWFGYGILFGAANGLGYSFSLQFSAQTNPRYRGWAMGLVTASYGLGAAVAPLPLDELLTRYGFEGGMIGLAVAIVSIGPVVAFLYHRSGCRLELPSSKSDSSTPESVATVARLWFAYGAAVFAGLMVIGHATGIVLAAGLKKNLMFVAPIIIALSNVAGSLIGGYVVDAYGARRPLFTVIALSAISLTVMSIVPTPTTTLAALAVVGFSYGATISAFPTAISMIFGSVSGIRVYGRVFTAWGTAGLAAPWLAGVLFESTGNYSATLMIAALFAVGSFVAIYKLPQVK